MSIVLISQVESGIRSCKFVNSRPSLLDIYSPFDIISNYRRSDVQIVLHTLVTKCASDIVQRKEYKYIGIF